MSAMVQATMSGKLRVKKDTQKKKQGACGGNQISRRHTACHQQLYTSERIHDTVLARPLTYISTLNFHFKIIENNSQNKIIMIQLFARNL